MQFNRPVLSSRASQLQRLVGYLPTLPIIFWLPPYKWRTWLPRDAFAGVAVSLVLLPQCLAFAALAGLPVRYGLLSSYLPPLIYTLLGTTAEVSMGPSALTCLLVSRTLSAEPAQDRPKLAFALSFFVGLLQFAVGLFRCGFLIELISQPAVSGFISSIALTVIVSQLKSFFHTEGSNRSFAASVEYTFMNIRSETDAHYPDLILGLMCILVLAILQYQQPSPAQVAAAKPGKQAIFMQVRRVLAVARFAIVMISSMVVAYIIYRAQYFWRVDGKPVNCTDATPCSPFSLVGSVKEGFEGVFGVPPLNTRTLAILGGNIPLIAFVGFIENISVARALKAAVDPSQEFLCLGAMNMFGSFFSSFTVSTSPPRSAVNKQSGVCSPLGGLVTSVLVLIVIEAATSLIFWIPKPALAAVVVMAALSMIQWTTFGLLCRRSKPEAAVMLIAFVSCTLLPVGAGLSIAVGAGLALFLYQTAGSPIDSDMLNDTTLLLSLNGQLLFPIVGQVRRAIRSRIVEFPQASAVVLDLSNVPRVDMSAALALCDLCSELATRGVPGHRAQLARSSESGTSSASGLDANPAPGCARDAASAASVRLIAVLARLQPDVAEHMSGLVKQFDALPRAASVDEAEELVRSLQAAQQAGSTSVAHSTSSSASRDASSS